MLEKGQWSLQSYSVLGLLTEAGYKSEFGDRGKLYVYLACKENRLTSAT